MKILDILNTPWMINIEYHQEMMSIYESHMRGEKIDFKAFESAFLESINKSPQENELNIQNGIAIINVIGPITPQKSFFGFLFGATSMPDISRQLKLADESSEVREKLFNMNTPGSTVEGMFELAEQVRESAKLKPIRTFTNGMIASGGYLIAAATDEILISGVANQIGSIGVITSKTDLTEAKKGLGIITTEYVSGKYKNIGSSDRKTDDFENKAIQETVDYMAGLFYENVSQDRNLDVEFIAGLEAKLLIGQQAIDAGLVDGVSTLEEIINAGDSGGGSMPSAKTLNIEVKNMGDKINLTLSTLEVDYPEVFQAASDKISSEASAVGCLTERERIKGITAAAANLPWLEKVVEDCIASGASVGEACQKMMAEQSTRLSTEGVKLRAETEKAVDFKETEQMQQSEDAASNKKVEKVEAEKIETPEVVTAEIFEASADMKAEFGDFGSYSALIEAEGKGQVNIFKGGSK